MSTMIVWRSRHNTYRNTCFQFHSPPSICVGDRWRVSTSRTAEFLVKLVTFLRRFTALPSGETRWSISSCKETLLKMNIVKPQSCQLDKLLYSIPETATLLSCSKSTIYSLMRSGVLPAVHSTSSARISSSAIVRYVEFLEIQSRIQAQEINEALR